MGKGSGRLSFVCWEVVPFLEGLLFYFRGSTLTMDHKNTKTYRQVLLQILSVTQVPVVSLRVYVHTTGGSIPVAVLIERHRGVHSFT